jgi:predicted permease
MGWSESWRMLRRVFRPRTKVEVEDEIRFHLEMRERDYAAKGLDAEKARLAARERFGDVERVRQTMERLQEGERREVKRREWLGEVSQDLRYGVRMMLKAPLVFATLVLTLSLGIGSVTAMFSVVNGVLLRPLPYADSDRLMQLWEVSPTGDDHNVVSSGNYLDWSDRSRSFEELGARRGAYGVALTGEGEPEQITVVDVTPSVFRILGVPPRVGRVFTDEDVRAGRQVTVLSHGFWQSRFGGDPGVTGRTVTLNGAAWTILGVMPEGFDYPSPDVVLWRPIAEAQLDPTSRRSHNYLVIGKLADGVGVAQARAEMREIASALAVEWPQFMQKWSVNVVPLHADMVAASRPLLLALLGGVVLVLLVACGNIANLLLARGMTRSREMAVRGALGAGRQRLVRQTITESLLLAVLGGALGVAVAMVLLRLLLAVAPASIPRLDDVRLDPAVLAFAGAVALLSTLLFGLLPSLRLARADLQGTLRSSDPRAGGAPTTRLRSALLVAEVALSLILLVAAGLLLRSAQRLGRVDYGYQPDGLIAVDLNLPYARYPNTAAHVAFYNELIDRLRVTPSVASVAGASESVASVATTFSFAIEGRPAQNASGREDPQPLRAVTPDYFRTLGIPVLAGRSFDVRDRAGAPQVIVIDQELARLHWPNQNPVGARISFSGPTGPWVEIIGVVGATRMTGADLRAAPALYIAHAQKTWDWMSWLTLAIRPAQGADIASIGTVTRNIVRQLDRDLPISRIAAFDQLYGEGLAGRRFATALFAGFAFIALLLGTIGMYGVLAYTVSQQQREIAIRMALGATSATVVHRIVRHALSLAFAGIVLGLLAALALSRLLTSLLFEVSPIDPLTLAGVSLLITWVALFSAWLPANRAAHVSPRSALADAGN